MRGSNRLASTSIAFVAASITLGVPEFGHAQRSARPRSAPTHSTPTHSTPTHSAPTHSALMRIVQMPNYQGYWTPPRRFALVQSLVHLGPASASTKWPPSKSVHLGLMSDSFARSSSSSSGTIYVRGFSSGDERIHPNYVFVPGDTTDGSDWSYNFKPHVDCGESCARIAPDTLRIAYAARARVLGARAMSGRSAIHDLALGSIKLGVAPGSRPAVLRQLSKVIADARRDEKSSGGSSVAVRAAFFPRGSFAIAEAPRGEDMLNAVKAAAAKMDDPVVFVFGMASPASGTKFINTTLADLRATTVADHLRSTLADLRATTVADHLRSTLEPQIGVHGVGIYALQQAGFALDHSQVEKHFGGELLPQTPSGGQDTPDSVSNQGVIVLVVSRKGPFIVLRDLVERALSACA